MVFPTGDYEATLHLAGMKFPAEVSLRCGTAPKWDRQGEIIRPLPSSADEIDAGGIRADLSNGGKAVFYDSELVFRDGAAFPEHGTSALVSWKPVDATTGSQRITFQISGLDPLIGQAPLQSPLIEESEDRPTKYVILHNPRATHSWTEGGMEAVCSYGSSIVRNNRHRLDLCFWPEFTFVSREALDIEEWVNRWVRPLLDLVSFLTRTPQSVTILKSEFRLAEDDSCAWAQLFQAGITQDPYFAENTWDVERQDRTPTVRLGELQMSLLQLIAKWRNLESEFGVVLDLYRASVFRLDIAARAKFLFLVQALEALHTTENRLSEIEETERHRQLRTDLFEAFANGSTSTPELTSFLKRNIGSRPKRSLEERLKALTELLPSQASEMSVNRDMGALAFGEPNLRLEKKVAILRNDLSHGNRAFDSKAVAAWADCLFALCHGHLLRLLGFGDDEIVQGLSRVYHARRDPNL